MGVRDEYRAGDGLDRVIAFSDAVVAIAITLTALPLVDSAHGLTSPASFFRDNGYALTAAGLTFLLVGIFWRENHQLFVRVRGYLPVTLRINQMWLAAIVFLPVATVLDVSASDRHTRLATFIYGGTILLIIVLQRIQESVLEHHELVRPDADRQDDPGWLSWLTVMLMALSVGISLGLPHLGLWPMVLLTLTGPIQHLVRGRRRAPAAPA